MSTNTTHTSLQRFVSAHRVVRVVAVVASALAVLAVVPSLAVSAQPNEYDDVPDDAYYATPVSELARSGVFAGTGCRAGFCPDKALDRKTMAVWVVRVLTGGNPPPIASSRFDDIDSDGFYAPFVEQMAELGVTRGCGNGSGFCPDDTVTRAQMAAFLVRAYHLAEGPAPNFSDVAVGAWYAADVSKLAASGITTGCGDGTEFCPGQNTTRAQMATFLWRAENRYTGTTATLDGLSPTMDGGGLVAAGFGYSCGLRIDQTIACWGSNLNGRADAPSGTFKAVAAGRAHGCGLHSDKTIACWGSNDNGQADAPGGTFEAVAAGGHHSCGLRRDLTMTCWGFNQDGQSNAPIGSFSGVAAGGLHSCGLRTDQTLTCWGSNEDRQGNRVGQADAPSGRFIAVAAGDFHSCAIRTDRTITCWGKNDEYVDYGDGYHPGQTDAPEGQFAAVSAGDRHSCGLRTDQTITCWGTAPSGHGFTAGAPSPQEGSFTAVSAGNWHSCGLRTDQTITCWADTDYSGVSEAAPGRFGSPS